MKQTLKTLALTTALSLAASLAQAAEAVTPPVGAISIDCPANSDTVVSVPFSRAPEFVGAATAINPTTGIITTSATLPQSYVGVASGTPSVITSPYYYVRFTSGSLNGRFYTITANDTTANSTITIDKNGEDWSGLTITGTETFKIVKYWTLIDLFPPANQSPLATDPATGTFILSTNNIGTGRQSELLVPNVVGVGTNLPPAKTYFVRNGTTPATIGWFESNTGSPRSDLVPLLPDTYFIVRHKIGANRSTKFVPSGSVDMDANVISFASRSGAGNKQDNFVALSRPKDVTLDELTAQGIPFTNSLNNIGTGRRDELLVFDNTTQAQNKPPFKTFFRTSMSGQPVNAWKESTTGNPPSGSFVIPAGTGFVIRKYETTGGVTTFFTNTPNY